MLLMQKIGLSVIVLLIVFAAGFLSAKRTVKPQIVTVEKQVVVQHDNIITHTVTVKAPNGQITTDTTTTDKSVTDTHTQETTKTADKQWLVAGFAGYDFKNKNEVYGGEVQKKLVGPVAIGAWAMTNGSIGISIGVEF